MTAIFAQLIRGIGYVMGYVIKSVITDRRRHTQTARDSEPPAQHESST